MSEENLLSVQGIVSSDKGAPFVQLKWPEDTDGHQMTPDEAREFASLVMEAAANATYEAAMVQWLMEELHLSEEAAGRAIGAMRIWRSDKWGQPTIPEDWRKP